MEDRNGGVIIAIGGVLTVVFLGIWILRFLQALFNELAKTFDAFGSLAASSLSMLGNVALVVILVAAIAGAIVAAVYFTYKYILLVKRATEIQELVDRRLHESEYKLHDAFRGFRHDIDAQIGHMDRVLTEALKEPDPAPQLPAATTETKDVTVSATPESGNAGTQASNDTAPDTEPPVSQPY